MERKVFEREAYRLRPILLRYAISMVHNDDEAEDVVQDALLRLWFFRDRLDSYRSVDAVAHVIIGRLCLNRLRDQKDKLSIEAAEEIIYESSVSIEESLWEPLLSAIESLPSTEQAVMKMKHIDGMETEEIATLISSSPSAVRTALSRARKKIRDRFLYRQ